MGHFRRRKFRTKTKKGLAKVKKDIKWLKKNIEFKIADTVTTNISVSTTGTITPLNLIKQDIGTDERIGSEITARRIAIRGKIENTNGTPVDTLVRIILFRERRVNGVITPLAELLSFGGASIPLSWRQMQNSDNIKVMFDTTFTMDTLTHSLIPFKLMYKLNHQVRYGGVASTIASLQTNGMFIVALSEVTAGANAPSMDLSARYSYVDS